MSPFLPPEAHLLRYPVAAVLEKDIRSPETQKAIDKMLEIAATQRTPQKMLLVGLAAPQVGIDKAIILVDTGVTEERTGWGELKVYINPQIVERSDEYIEGREGCFSVDSRVTGIVSRAKNIKIVAFDRNGSSITEVVTGFTARIFQHEVDHLHGIRFPERVGENGTLHWVEKEQHPEYRLKWRDWPVRCSWNTWLDMKEGRPILVP